MAKILRFVVLILILVALWCAVLWLGLPQEWTQRFLQNPSLPSLIALHVAPPLFVVAVWRACKRVWSWGAARAEKRAAAKKAAEQEATQVAAKATHQETLEKRRAYLECRAVWAMAVAHKPDWAEVSAQNSVLTKQGVEEIKGTLRERALISSLQQVLDLALSQCETAVWLPVMLVADAHAPAQLGWIKRAWQEAVEVNGKSSLPGLSLDCKVLPGNGAIPDRVIALFESNPDLPAVLLVGMDSPLADTPETDEEDSGQPKPGHAVAMVLLSRPGLTVPENASLRNPERDANPYTPFWERDLGQGGDTPGWGRVPPSSRSVFLEGCPAIATLHRMSAIGSLATKRSALSRQIQDAVQDALVLAGLRELPLKGEEPGSDKQADSKGGELEWGRLVHDANPDRLGALALALANFDCDINPLKEASDLLEEHGNVGTARGMLMLAEALVHAAKLKKPVLLVETAEGQGMNIGLVRSV